MQSTDNQLGLVAVCENLPGEDEMRYLAARPPLQHAEELRGAGPIIESISPLRLVKDASPAPPSS